MFRYINVSYLRYLIYKIFKITCMMEGGRRKNMYKLKVILIGRGSRRKNITGREIVGVKKI